jgi:hypothetical protein
MVLAGELEPAGLKPEPHARRPMVLVRVAVKPECVAQQDAPALADVMSCWKASQAAGRDLAEGVDHAGA